MYLLCLLLAGSGCGRPTVAEVALRPSQVHDFDALYAQNCSACHGAEGKLGPAPPLNDPLFLAIVAPDELRQTIALGRHGTMMPAFASDQGGSLTPLQIEVLIEGLQRWHQPEIDASSLPSYLGQAEAEAAVTDTKTAEQLFATHCGDCHGQRGEGGMGGALHVPAFLALISDQALRRVIITGRPDLGMPDYRNRTPASGATPRLTSAQIDQLVALLASWRDEAHAPAPTDAQAMR